jgi:peptidoglycan/LPS O-acetylase OafA/YrhL
MNVTNNSTREGKLYCLELLRFILAFLTMAWHYYCFGPAIGEVKLGGIYFPVFRYLSFTVEVFFIISGFIIIASAINRKPADFLIARIVRLAPCLLLCATITMAAGFLLGNRVSIKSYLASIFLVPLAFHKGVDWSYWSLRYEIIFYSLIFLTLCLANIERNIYKIALMIILYDALSILTCIFFGQESYFSTIIREPGGNYASFFAIGILLYLIIIRKKLNPVTVSTLLVACFLGCVRCYQEASMIGQSLSSPRVSLLDGCCIFLVVFGVFICFVRVRAIPRFHATYSWLGKTSYPLYLLHQNIGYSIFAFIGRRMALGFDIRPVVMVAMVALAGAIANFAEPVLATQYKRWLSSMREAMRLVYPRVHESGIGDAE